MSLPKTEPNSLPDVFVDWVEWRALYGETVDAFYKTPGTVSDRVMLQIALRRLGFVGGALDAEIEFIVTNKGN